jgi:hypothetical protein
MSGVRIPARPEKAEPGGGRLEVHHRDTASLREIGLRFPGNPRDALRQGKALSGVPAQLETTVITAAATAKTSKTIALFIRTHLKSTTRI